jgi:hypothetical protein
MVPRPTPCAASATSNSQRESQGHMAEMYERIMALSDSILSLQVEQDRPSETAKKLSDVKTCRLLGYCGLGWSE